MLTDNLTVKDNTLYIGGVSTLDLAREYGTPLYVFDENLIRENMRSFKNAFDKYYQGNGTVCYASKAFCCLEMCRIAKEEGINLDVSSIGELHTALKSGFPASKIVFHGNNKTTEELAYAIDNRIWRFAVDNITELKTLNTLAAQIDRNVDIIFRIKPGVEAHTHDFVKTGQIDSKFGFSIEPFGNITCPKNYRASEAYDAVKTALNCTNVNLKGLHCHIGSQIMETEPFELACEILLDFVKIIKDDFGVVIEELDFGGGFGIKYLETDDFIPYEEYIKKYAEVIEKITAEKSLKKPFISIEPGRSIAGPAGITLYTVGAVKHMPGIRTYVSIDGGMTDNPRYALYKSEYEAICANKAAEKRDTPITLAGKCCESGDLIGENMPLQKVASDDIIAVLATGAYNYSMASNYNRVPRPAVVFVKDGTHRLVIKRETLDDIIKNDI